VIVTSVSAQNPFSFVSAFFENPKSVGSIMPSSRSLALEITKSLAVPNRKPLRILEVGAGDGAFTKVIAEFLRDKDRVDIIEIDENLARGLHALYAHNTQIKVHCCSVLDFKAAKKYDVIISGLPFNSFEAPFVADILYYYKAHIKRGGVLSYFTYLFLPRLWSFFADVATKSNLEAVLATTERFRAQYQVTESEVYLNIPPARVYHITIQD
jgi:phospholipid N-methyltransferase